MTDRTTVLFAATAVALTARTGGLTQNAVDDLRTKAEELLERGDDLRLAVLSFATMWEEYHRDAYALEKLGEHLGRAVEQALNPEARPMRERRDIDG